jgi:galactose mutarotase-like enzyme
MLTNDISNYSVIFEADDELSRYMVEGNLVSYNTVKLPFSDKKVLPLKREFFNDDALIFMDHKSRKVELKNNVTNESILVEFKDFDYLLIWTKETDAPFVCIEPWYGRADRAHFNGCFEEKDWIQHLDGYGKFEVSYTITIH